jgi:hypothetical protein
LLNLGAPILAGVERDDPERPLAGLGLGLAYQEIARHGERLGRLARTPKLIALREPNGGNAAFGLHHIGFILVQIDHDARAELEAFHRRLAPRRWKRQNESEREDEGKDMHMCFSHVIKALA